MKRWLSMFVVVCTVVAACSAQDKYSADISTGSVPERWQTVSSIDEVTAAYDKVARQILPVLIPETNGVYHQNVSFGDLIIDLDSKLFLEEFINKLSAQGVVGKNGVMTYPIVISLEKKTHDFLIYGADNKMIMRVKRPEGYDPLWFTRAYFANSSAYADIEVSAKEFELHSRIYDPAKIIGHGRLLTVEAATAIENIEAAKQSEPIASEPFVPMAMAAGGTNNDVLCISAIEPWTPTSNDVQVTISYPTELRDQAINIIGSTNLITRGWELLVATNTAVSSNSFTVATPHTGLLRFIACYRPGIDSDGGMGWMTVMKSL